jgi:hypothetical protein
MIAAAAVDVRVLEEGDLGLFYRPRVERPRVRSLADVQRLFLVLAPHGRRRHRLLAIGRKRLPDPSERGREKFWGIVGRVEDAPGDIRDELEPHGYATRTRGWREQPGARLAGEGTYRLLRHGSHTHLTYALSGPPVLGEVQEDLRIQPQASYVITVKNPARRAEPDAAADDPGAWSAAHHDPSVSLPPGLMARFRGRRYAEVDPPEFLDHEGVEFILIAASDDVEAELGVSPAAEDGSAPRDIAEILGLEAVEVGPPDGDWE